jgi:hypothetical protein
MPHSYNEYRDTPLWRALARAVEDLQATREIRVETAPDYVIGYLYQELVAKSVVASEALARPR